MNVEDLARLQVLFFKENLSPLDMNYIAKLSCARAVKIFAMSLFQQNKHWKLCVVDEYGQCQGIIEKFSRYIFLLVSVFKVLFVLGTFNQQNFNTEVEAFKSNLLLNQKDLMICSDELKTLLNSKKQISWFFLVFTL